MCNYNVILVHGYTRVAVAVAAAAAASPEAKPTQPQTGLALPVAERGAQRRLVSSNVVKIEQRSMSGVRRGLSKKSEAT